jgi:uncharacterized protein
VAEVTRRTFLEAAAGLATVARIEARRDRNAVSTEALQAFPYGAVQLTNGPLKRQFDENHSFFLHLSEDRLLKIYRRRAGLPAPGENMGGWYDDFCPGAHFGQYVSALARFAAATNSDETRAKVGRLVHGYAQTVDSSGKIFVDLRYPAYTYDKLVCMMIDAHSYTGEQDAAAILQATTQAARPHMPEKALTKKEQRERPHKDETYTWDESYTLAENLFLAYERMGDRQYFDMAKRYLLDETFFDPLSQGENVLPGLHAYSHVNALSSGMQGYLKLGDKKYFRAVSNAVEMIWKGQSFATGGWGPNEEFVQPGKGLLGASLSKTHRSFETPCGAYAHFKVMRYLLSLTRDGRYGDSMERVLYNTVLGAKPIQIDGSSFYYSDYHYSGFKTEKRVIPESKYPWDHDGRWPCCSGTLPQLSADYTISAYLRSRDGIYVNLYVPSQLTWVDSGVKCMLSQQTSYPTDNLVNLKVQLSRSHDFSLYLRVPAWAGANTSVSINGKRVTTPVNRGSFYELRRTWKSGDEIEYEIDQRVGTQAVDAQNLDQVAIIRGPQVLFAIADSPQELTPAEADRLQLKKAEGDNWSLTLETGNVNLRPFWSIENEIYQTYWKVRV